MRFYESLFILTYTYDNITFLSEVMDNNNFPALDVNIASDKDVFHYTALFKHCILETCSFLEEYDENFYQLSEIEYKERILFIKTAGKPILKKINEWKDLKKMRNELIAHPWRTKKTKTFTYVNIFNYNSPRNYMELQILRYYLTMIVGLIEAEFKDELQQVPHYMNTIAPSLIPPKINNDIIEEMNKVINAVNSTCTSNKKWYILDAKKIIGI